MSAAPPRFQPCRPLGRTGFLATRLGAGDLADRYTLTLDPDVALLGLSFPNEQDAAFAAAEAFEPLSGAQLADVRRRAEEAIRGKGRCWWNPEPSPSPR